MSFHEALRRVQEVRIECGRPIQPPCPPQQLALLKQRVREKLGCELPRDYEEFLSLSNGLEWNSMYFYSAGYDLVANVKHQDILELVGANLDFREFEYFRTKLLLGEGGTDFYIYDLDDGHTAMIDRGGGPPEYETFSSVAELLEAAMLKSIRPPEE